SASVSSAGSSSCVSVSRAARWTADGKTSLEDCPRLTSSFGWTSSPASAASTSFAFMFDDVPDPVWKTSIGNWSSCSPAATASPPAAIRSASSGSSLPSSALTRAAAAFSRPSSRTTGTGTRSPETGKFSTAFVVSPPQSCSVKVVASIVSSIGSVFNGPRGRPLAEDLAGFEAFFVGAFEPARERPASGAVLGGGFEPADELGVDPMGVFGAAFDGAEEKAELDRRRPGGLVPGLAVEGGGRAHHRDPHRRQLAGALIQGQ